MKQQIGCRFKMGMDEKLKTGKGKMRIEEKNENNL